VTVTYDCGEPADRARGISAAINAAKRGDLVVFPTDTVYGLGTDAFSSTGVAALRAAKGRGRDLPIPVLVSSRAALESLTTGLTPAARDLAHACWPGALTLVCRAAGSLAWDLNDGAGAVAIRMPLHPVALEVVREVGPMALTSTNRPGEPAATTMQQARDALGPAVAVYLDGGPSPETAVSTVIDVSGPEPRLVREGGFTREMLLEICPTLT
jgi:tRNA threonylcarbamoyl adenosine modification protein (Sua5/YciO/YrdC/YwlC family)